jgi:hypothetical protein
VTTASLWPPNGRFVNVGLSVTPSGFSGTVTYTVNVYSNQANDGDADAKWNGTDPTTLELAAERAGGNRTGRVYLILVTATDTSGNTASSGTTVVVPHDQSKAAKSRVTAAAAGAEAYFTNNGKPPPGYVKIL